MNNPLVSVLMTAHNREKYIGQAIESVLASTYLNFELIIVDDCSTDNTVSIARQYEQKDSRVKLYINEKNLGDYNNRNRAASYASGKYLKYIDSDDLVYPHCLQVMVSSMEKFPEAVYGFSYRLYSANHQPFPREVQGKDAYREHYLQGGFFYAGPGSSIIRKAAFDAIGGFTGKRFVGDTELWMTFSQKHSCVLLQRDLMWWRIHEGQESVSEQQNNEGVVIRYQSDKTFLTSPACPLDERTRLFVLNNMERALWRTIIHKALSRFDFTIYKRTKPPVNQMMLSLLPVNKFTKIFKMQRLVPNLQ